MNDLKLLIASVLLLGLLLAVLGGQLTIGVLFCSSVMAIGTGLTVLHLSVCEWRTGGIVWGG